MTSQNEKIIELVNLSKCFGDHKVLDNINLEIKGNEFFYWRLNGVSYTY